MDVIIGKHAIHAALGNPNRKDFELFIIKEHQKLLESMTSGRDDIQKVVLSKHDFQEKSQKIYRQNQLEYRKISGGALLTCSCLEMKTPQELYETCQSQKQIKMIILDGVTDVHNAGAIVRTASFYGVDILLVGGSSFFRMTPSFYKIASGGVEHLKVIHAGTLPRTVKKIQDLGVMVIALSEKANEPITRESHPKMGMILGSEDRGISHALLRQCQEKRVLRSKGHTLSLNVSVAAAVAMERLFGR